MQKHQEFSSHTKYGSLVRVAEERVYQYSCIVC